jgi:signal transduction histidine kinase/ActR/RegA family two-component response regulator
MIESRILVLAPTGRDASVTCEVLRDAGLHAEAYRDMPAVSAAIRDGAGAMLVAEEAFDAESFALLARTLDEQEPWSDLPIVLLAGSAFSDSADRAGRVLAPLRNVMVLERPIRVSVLVAAMQVGLRARLRQYELRRQMAERERAAAARARALEAEQDARREAEAANRLKDEFLATVSHELRTPVNVILGWAGMLSRDGVGDARQAHAIEVIFRNARAQARVIDELLDISRIISGKIRMEVAPVELMALLDEAVDAVRPALEGKRLTITTDASSDIPRLYGDTDRLRQVFFNLLTNAAKFTPEGGRIAISAARSSGQVEIRIADTGIGIPADVLPYVFDRFRQADSTTTRSYGGLGLGLAIVRQLVELHGGTVEAKSAGPGLGTELIVRLPTAARARPERTAEPDTRGGTPGGELPRLTDVRLLIVDDDPDGREMVAELLQGLGAIVTGCASGGEALTVLDELKPDVIVADIAMPGVDGFTLMDRLRGTLGVRKPPAIALSAYARAEDQARALASGFDAHVPKPVDALLLVRTIRELLAHRRLTSASG